MATERKRVLNLKREKTNKTNLSKDFCLFELCKIHLLFWNCGFMANEIYAKETWHTSVTHFWDKWVYFSVDEDQRQWWGLLLSKYKSINKMRVFVIEINFFNSASWRRQMCLTNNTLYYPTARHRVQITPKTSTNITRY